MHFLSHKSACAANTLTCFVKDSCGSQEPSNNKTNPMQAVMDKLGNGLVKLGEDVISAGGHLGGMFVGLGNNLRGTM